ncbi:hypothetical protein TNIN_191661 [Trichonephila inaurata madagascariensis]|uniref:Uncharacterized protein n=1 Tax=Trichonephila inaurata madagascariensis TaxID=2747483 RepID=A0A8X6IVQ2_9ARAC|nr:hypothetical protein TNIN_191661 [Trichonephila inaurata madagascariensis]
MLTKKERTSVNAIQMFTCLTSPVALLDIEVYETTGANDSPVEINSSSCPTNSIPSEVPLQSNSVDETETNDLHLREEEQALNVEDRNDLMVLLNESDHPPVSIRLSPNRKETDNLLADIYQKQVEKGGIINIEALRNKYLLEISNAPTRGNTAENSVPDEANDVDATPKTDSSTKPEGNASVMRNDRASGSKDMRIGSGNEPRSKDVRCVGRTKNDRFAYTKQSRGNSNRNNS